MLAVGTLNTKVQLLENQGQLKMSCCEIQKTVNTLFLIDQYYVLTNHNIVMFRICQQTSKPLANWPFPSCLVPVFEIESSSRTFHIVMSSA